MGCDISLHAKEVKDEEKLCSTSRLTVRLDMVPVPDSPRQSPSAWRFSLCSEIASNSLFSSHLLALALSSAELHLFFRGFLVSYFLMTMQSVFGWEIPREEACCYLREIMKSIPNERTGENPSTKLHWSLRLSFLWASNLSCLMSYQQMQLEASKTLPACCWFYGMKIRDDRIANYSFHSVSLGRREYPEQSQLLPPFLSIGNPPICHSSNAAVLSPHTQGWLGVQDSLWADGRARGNHRCRLISQQ